LVGEQLARVLSPKLSSDLKLDIRKAAMRPFFCVYFLAR
jgi:hypothetical protein